MIIYMHISMLAQVITIICIPITFNLLALLYLLVRLLVARFDTYLNVQIQALPVTVTFKQAEMLKRHE